ncbi:MAG: homoserine O-acetyltransferase [Muribaculaceae bacterium]|nr:homoserine O-acetyltransferase [Muribaculaceae bacterium]
MTQFYHHKGRLDLEIGGYIENPVIAYHTYGTLNEKQDNVLWVCHALTANSDVADWFPHTVEEGACLDPSKYFVICANILGSPYGTVSPLHENPETGEPYYTDFPKVTIRDMVRAHSLLANHLGIGRVKALIGCSVGGFQAIEWAVQEPERFERMILCATDAKATPWTIALDETQRMAIKADKSYGERRPDAGMAGLAAARAIGLISYRGPEGYNLTQQDPDDIPADSLRRAVTYQRHQGDKLCRRYNAYSYMTILDAFDTHDIGRGRGGVAKALESIRIPTLVVGLTTDIVFPPEDMRHLAEQLPRGEYAQISSPFGHDGFLIESDQMNALFVPFIEKHFA